MNAGGRWKVVVSYTSDYLKEYAVGLNECKSRQRLNEFLEHWLHFASDAYAARPTNEVEFKQFVRGLRSERKGRYAGDEWALRFGAILMPDLMFQVATIAVKFGVPWGLAFIRMQETGLITQNQMGVYVVKKPDA